MKLIDLVKNIDICVLVRREYWRKKGWKNYNSCSDYEWICKYYYKRNEIDLNLSEPVKYYEKINWLKLFYRTSEIKECSDKFTVRDYIKKKGCTELLNELYGAYKSIDEINLGNLPDRFVIKASHGSGWNLIVKNKQDVNWFIWRKIMRSWMKQNASWFGREWNYATDDPRLVVERYLEDETGQLRDYKVFCFNGNPEFIMLEENRYSNHKRVFCDCDGQILDMNDGFGFEEGTTVDIFNTGIWSKMLNYARKLSEPFPHVRVDFFICNNKLYFGEMTFFNDAGYGNFYPDKWNYIWGEKLVLPEPNYNLELYHRLNNQ